MSEILEEFPVVTPENFDEVVRKARVSRIFFRNGLCCDATESWKIRLNDSVMLQRSSCAIDMLAKIGEFEDA